MKLQTKKSAQNALWKAQSTFAYTYMLPIHEKLPHTINQHKRISKQVVLQSLGML
jgi:hypothetical protein